MYACYYQSIISEAAPAEGLELPVGEEGRVWAEAGGALRGPAAGERQDLAAALLQRAPLHPRPRQGAHQGGAGGAHRRARTGGVITQCY